MQSSKVEKSFDADFGAEQSKNISPLNYYHPFQSTFDPDFGKLMTPSEEHVQPDPSSYQTKLNKDGQLLERCDLKNGMWKERSSSWGSFSKSEEKTKSSDDISLLSAWDLSFAERYYNAPSASSLQINANPVRICQGLFRPSDPSLKQLSPGSTNFQEPDLNFLSERRPTLKFGNFDGDALGLRTAMTASTQFGHSADSIIKSSGFSTAGDPLAVTSSQDVQKSGYSRPMMCNFCKNNKEVPDIYLNHYLYDPKTKKLTCPVLRKHVCEICGETGDRAHTLQYCPINKQRGFQAKIPVLLKTRTITNSTGKIRRN